MLDGKCPDCTCLSGWQNEREEKQVDLFASPETKR